jgi:hypothetical protein
MERWLAAHPRFVLYLTPTSSSRDPAHQLRFGEGSTDTISGCAAYETARRSPSGRLSEWPSLGQHDNA